MKILCPVMKISIATIIDLLSTVTVNIFVVSTVNIFVDIMKISVIINFIATSVRNFVSQLKIFLRAAVVKFPVLAMKIMFSAVVKSPIITMQVSIITRKTYIIVIIKIDPTIAKIVSAVGISITVKFFILPSKGVCSQISRWGMSQNVGTLSRVICIISRVIKKSSSTDFIVV